LKVGLLLFGLAGCLFSSLNAGAGYWTATPSKWSNAYFKILSQNAQRFQPMLAPGGQHQYTINGASSKFMMLPSDISLTFSQTYNNYVQLFAANASYLTQVFGEAWYKVRKSK
jgi:catalase (peroxidase I)